MHIGLFNKTKLRSNETSSNENEDISQDESLSDSQQKYLIVQTKNIKLILIC